MSEITGSPPAAKKQKTMAMDGSNFDMESLQIEIDALKKENTQSKRKIEELEKKLEEKKVVWRLCKKHDKNGKARDCSTGEDRKMYPFYVETNIGDLIEKIPDVAETIFRYLDLESAVKCRRVNKSWKSFVEHTYQNNILMAVAAGDTVWVKALISEGANVNAKLKITRCLFGHRFPSGNNDKTPLHLAAMSSLPHRVEIAKLLVESGADIEARDNSKDTPLLIAAKKGGQHSGDFLKLLINAGADIEAGADKREDKWALNTPLLVAIENIGKNACAVDNIKIILDAGADLKARKDAKYYFLSPLNILLVHLIKLAVKNGIEAMNYNLKVIDMFLAAGAKKWARDRDYHTPIKHVMEETKNLTKYLPECHDPAVATIRYNAAIKKLADYYNSLPGEPEPKPCGCC